MLGNQFYDRAVGNSGQLYGVREAATKMEQTKALDRIDISAELPVSIIRDRTPAASLPSPPEQYQDGMYLHYK